MWHLAALNITPTRVKSHQTPLTAKRGGDPHDFAQGLANWEAAVFDAADLFTAVAMRPRRRFEFKSFPDALKFVREQPDQGAFLIYAVTASGRSMVPEPALWDDWLTRLKPKDQDNG